MAYKNKKIIAIVLLAAMLFMMIPAGAFAESTTDSPVYHEPVSDAFTAASEEPESSEQIEMLDEQEELTDNQEEEITEETVTEVKLDKQYVSLPNVATSAPAAALFALNDSVVPLEDGHYVRWIDRLDLTDADYAWDLYHWMETSEDLIDPYGAAQLSNGEYVYEVVQFTGAEQFDYTGDEAVDTPAALEVIRAEIDENEAEAAAHINAVYGAFDRDHPEVFWLSGETRYISDTRYAYNSDGEVTYTQTFYLLLLSPDFDIRAEEYRSAEMIYYTMEEREEAVADILDAAEGDSYEMVRYFNEWLTNHNSYNTNGTAAGHYAHECISALSGSTGVEGPVCEGYARAFKVLCDAAEIPCVLVDGDATNLDGASEAHMWNYVMMDDYSWYAVDVTWNDPNTGNQNAVSGQETENYLLVGGDTVVADSDITFGESHSVANQPFSNGPAFINGPILSDTAYEHNADSNAPRQLAAPTNLIWNDPDDPNDIQKGIVSWGLVDNCEGEYRLELFKDGVYYTGTNWHDVYDRDGSGRFTAATSDWFSESGSYYFTVQAIGDGEHYTDSEIAVSEVWEYVRPDVQVETPYGLMWKDNKAYWYGSDETDYYMVEYYKDGDNCGGIWGYADYDSELGMYMEDSDYFLEILGWEIGGIGEYIFTVCALSKDITISANGEVSAPSPVNSVTETSGIVSAITGNLAAQLENNKPAEFVRGDLIDFVDTDDLAVAMVTTESVRENIETLEDAYADALGITVTVDVTNEVQDAGVPTNFAITGAALNTEENDSTVAFKVSKPDENYTADETEYKNTVFVYMNLKGVTLNPDGSLLVPVYITMPVPDNITVQDRFRILHYQYSSDEYEVIHPTIVKGADQVYYASFALTHFSPFAFTELVDPNQGAGQPNNPAVETIAMHRLYNPNSGEHFYTGSVEERDMLVSVGWNYEGIAWNAPVNGGTHIYRLFNPNNGDHHYTGSIEERDMLVSVGWQYEGVAWNSAGHENVPQYRLFNPNADCGSHHYTGSTEERDFLVSLGWHYEGIGWYGMP